MKNENHKPACDQVRLEVLLFGQEDSAEFNESARHLESCPLCRDRLTQLAANDNDWDLARCSLKAIPGMPTSFETPLSDADSSACHVPLDFLDAPSHPEMLGRLGRYEIERVIGMGGMGIVLKGFDTELHRPVAIKVLAPHLGHSGAARQRFAREARAAAAVVHEHVVAIHNVDSECKTPFLVMQFVVGRSLQDRVEQDGPLTATEVLRIGLQAAAGLAAAHLQGVIHRDVKPANILLEDGVDRALLTDFGLARAVDDASLTRSGIILGTPHYMSPEQANGEPADVRSDLFSLGAVLYFMATGHPPFRADRAMAVLHRICRERHRPVQEINTAIPNVLADVIDRLLEKKPSRRYATAAETHQALAAVLSSLQQPRRWNTRRWFRCARDRFARLSLAALAVLLIAGSAWLSHWFTSPAITSLPNESSEIQGTESLSALDVAALEFTSGRTEFMRQLTAIERSIEQVHHVPFPESGWLRSANGMWTNDLTTAKSAVNQLEQSWPKTPDDPSSLNSSKGDLP